MAMLILIEETPSEPGAYQPIIVCLYRTLTSPASLKLSVGWLAVAHLCTRWGTIDW